MSVTPEILDTIERKLQTSVRNELRQITTRYLGAYNKISTANPQMAGVHLTSDLELNQELQQTLGTAQTRVTSSIRAGWIAAAALALKDSQAQDKAAGAPGDFLDAVLSDVANAFAVAGLAIIAAARDTHDEGRDLTPTARLLLVRKAVEDAVRRLSVSTGSAAAVTVRRAYHDTQIQVAATSNTDQLTWVKKWRVNSLNPCPACAALHGTIIGISEDFDGKASTDSTFKVPAVYHNLAGPPRHPNCKCSIDIEPDVNSVALRDEVSASTPGRYRWLSAQDIRQMSDARFGTLAKFLERAARRMKTLLKKIRDDR
jgi:hypothetical protein